MTQQVTKTTLAKITIDGTTYELTRTGEGDCSNPTPGIDPKTMLQVMERDLLKRVMIGNEWNKSRTAKKLGIHRHTLIGRLQAKGLHPTTTEIREEHVEP